MNNFNPFLPQKKGNKNNSIFGIDPINLNPKNNEKRKRKLTPADKKRIAANQKWKCNVCKKTLPVRYHVDHKKEFSKNGSDNESNLQALCGTCHDNKTEEDRHKNKKTKSKKKDNNNLLFENMLGLPKKSSKKNNNPFDFKF